MILEHRFGADTDGVALTLQRRVVYRAELNGPGTLTVEPVQRRPRPAFLVPIGDTTAQPRRFEVYAFEDGPHSLRVVGMSPGDSAILRVYRDTMATERIARKRDRAATLGLAVAGGIHTGYRLDPTGGANPRGGTDLEACLLLEVADRVGTCVGAARQSFPDAGFTATWVFLEERVRLVSRPFLGTRRTDLAAAIRVGKGVDIGPRRLDPDMLGFGLFVTQQLSREGRRRGWRTFLAWQHGRLVNAPETEFLDTDRFAVGLIWAP